MPFVNVDHISIILLIFTPIVFSQHYYFFEINSTPGRIRGLRIRTARNKEALAFLGIPYAAPPLDRLRFKVLNIFCDSMCLNVIVISLQWLIQDGMEFWTQLILEICVRNMTPEAINWEAKTASSSMSMRPFIE